MSCKSFLICHTHWDREWRIPYEETRLKLVENLDRVMKILENDPAFRCFLLDGQVVIVEDYLSLRPSEEERSLL